MSLLEEVQRARRDKGYKSQGLDSVLDLTPHDQNEFVLFCRKLSLLQTKIGFIHQARTAEDVITAMLLRAAKGYCRMCYEFCKGCECPDEVKDWV